MKKSELNKQTVSIMQQDSEIYKNHLFELLKTNQSYMRSARIHNNIVMGLCSVQTLAIIYMVLEIIK